MAQLKFGGAVIKQLIVAQSTAITVTGTGVDCSALRGVVAVILDASAVSAGDTFDVKLQCSDAVGGTYHDVLDYDGEVVAFTQCTDAAVTHEIKYFDIAQRNGHPWIRALATMATNGGTVSCVLSATLIGFPQYV